MFAAFKERRPWAAALIALVLGPFVGMLYLNRGRTALGYLAAMIVVNYLAEILSSSKLLSSEIAILIPICIYLAFAIAGAIHAYLAMRRDPLPMPLRWYAQWYVVGGVFLVLGVLSMFFTQSPDRSFSISSGSMEPSFVPGDRVLALKTAYRNAQPKRGDTVVFYVPHENNVIFIKRLVGLPGDRVQMRNGFLYVNGAPASLQKLGDIKGDCTTTACETFHQYIETLPGGPPHRIQKTDFASYLDNTGVFVVPADSYFVLGDNRSNSRDSRMDDFGYIPRSAIIGHAAIRFFDGTRNKIVWEKVD